MHLFFFSCVALLSGMVIFYFYLTPSVVIQPPAPRDLPEGHPELPGDHPPMELAKELMALERLSEQEPENPEHKIRIGNLYFDMRQYQRAIQAYQQAMALSPENPSVETDMATCFHYLGQYDEALTILAKVLEYRPGFPQALFNKGVVLYEGRSDKAGAIAVWEELLRTNPDFVNREALQRRIRELKSAGA